MKLNLGCGNFPIKGYKNFDKYSIKNEIEYIDLEQLPLSFDNNSIDEILLYDVLEHLWINPYDFMLEIHRILKKDGIIKVTLPSFSDGITHIRHFHTRQYFKPLCNTKRGRITGSQVKILFKLISVKTKFNKITKAFPFIYFKHHYILQKI